MSTLDAVAADVRVWYDRYVDTFTGLAASERDDLDALLEYFGAPLVIVTEDRYVASSTRDAVRSAAQALIDRLRQANYAGSAVHHLAVRPLNARAAFIEGTISRFDRAGNEFERFGTTYLAAKTDDGWRFTAVVYTLP
jgi:SnoaL-like domain